jgi:hypothetical protein
MMSIRPASGSHFFKGSPKQSKYHECKHLEALAMAVGVMRVLLEETRGLLLVKSVICFGHGLSKIVMIL